MTTGTSQGRRIEAVAPSRRVRELKDLSRQLARHRLSPLQVCEAVITDRIAIERVRRFFSGLPRDEKHYWVASLYALLIPKERRKRLATYFTPPHLAHYAIRLLLDEGLRLGVDRIHDPASGGAAFLVPLAGELIKRGRVHQQSVRQIEQAVASTLSGAEIEPQLARLSELLMRDMLRHELGTTKAVAPIAIERCNSLKRDVPAASYDAVIANPPYGRVLRPAAWMLRDYKAVISDGYVNLYALFVEHAIRWTKPGGHICLIIPISFLGGPHFAALRNRILEAGHLLRLDLIDKRDDLFLDVLYDVAVLLIRKKGRPVKVEAPRCRLIISDGKLTDLGRVDVPDLPSERAWAIPDGRGPQRLFADGCHTLASYGYVVKAGYFVWNREQHRYRVSKAPRVNEVPLFWAHNIRANAVCFPYADPQENKVGCVRIERATPVVRVDAILLQRTSNRRQKRRLVAGLVRQSKVPGGRGFVTENHTIAILPDPKAKQRVPLRVLCRLLNTAAVDDRFRRMSGTVSVSTTGLRELPLPDPDLVRLYFSKLSEDERAAQRAYERSTETHENVGR